MKRAIVLLLIAGLVFAVYAQAGYLERKNVRTHGYDGFPKRTEWAPRIATLWLAERVGAEGRVALWIAGWFALSCLAWYLARGPDCLVPVLVLAVATLAIYHPLVPCGTHASEGPTMFFFSLAALTHRRAFVWWPFLGILAIPFKQTGAVLVIVAAGLWWLRGYRWHAAWLVVAGGLVALGCALRGGMSPVQSVRLTSMRGTYHLPVNLRHMARPPSWLVAGGTALAGLFAGRGPVLSAMLMLVVLVFVLGTVSEPRIWIEVAALAAAVVPERILSRPEKSA